MVVLRNKDQQHDFRNPPLQAKEGTYMRALQAHHYMTL